MSLKARLVYRKDSDEFRLEVWDGQSREWGLDIACKCVRCAEDPNGDANYIHYSILNEIRNLVARGYAIQYGG